MPTTKKTTTTKKSPKKSAAPALRKDNVTPLMKPSQAKKQAKPKANGKENGKSAKAKVTPKPIKAKAADKPKKVKAEIVIPEAITVERPKRMASDSEALVAFDPDRGHLQLGKSVVNLINRLPKMADQDVERLFLGSVEMERAAWVIKGAAAHEIVTRKTADGAQFSKQKGLGLDTLINEIAKEIGVSSGFTLRDDYKAFAEFNGYIKEQLTENPEALMPREFYVLASKTGKEATETPFEVLQYFEEQRQATGGYFVDHARRDLKWFNEGRTVEEVRKLDAAARIEAVNRKKTSTDGTKPQVITDKTMQVQVARTPANAHWMTQIIQKYGSFTAWFEKHAKAEFGAFKESN